MKSLRTIKLIVLALTMTLSAYFIYGFKTKKVAETVVHKAAIQPLLFKKIIRPTHLKDYELTKKNVQIIKSNYQNANDSIKVKAFNNVILDSIFDQWYGTDWDFNGMTTTPQKGKIACGYFVTTTLQDAGIAVKRIKYAQMASEEMITLMVNSNDVHRYRKLCIEKFNDEIKKLGEGLYLVGLDCHAGFVLNQKDSIYFIHSSGVYPYKVMKEPTNNSYLIAFSKYRIVGKISTADFLNKHWLSQ